MFSNIKRLEYITCNSKLIFKSSINMEKNYGSYYTNGKAGSGGGKNEIAK